MAHVKTCGGLMVVALLGSAGSAFADSFSTTEQGVWNQTLVGTSATTIDALTVTSTNPDPPTLVFDSALLVASTPGPASMTTADYTLYGATASDYLEFQLTGAFSSLGQAGNLWFSGTGTLIGSGGSFANYVTGNGTLAATFLPTATIGNSTTGVSSGLFYADVNPSPAPEPASFAALGIAGIGLLRRRRRR